MIPFLFKGTILYENFLYALLVGLMVLRAHFNGNKKFNLKPFFVTLFLSLLFVISIIYRFEIQDIFYPDRHLYPNNISTNYIKLIFAFNGLTAIGFLLYNIKLYKGKGNLVYMLLEGGVGTACLMYTIFHARAFVLIHGVVLFSICIHFIYFGFLVYTKILERKLQKQAKAILLHNSSNQ